MSTSKSHANRALVLGALKGKGICLNEVPQSTDVINLLNAFKKIGLKIIQKDRSITFLNSFPECERESNIKSIDLHTGDGGTTNRFLIPLLALGKKEYKVFPTEQLSQRPIDELISPLKNLGVKIQIGNAPWLTIQGPINISQDQSVLKIDCSKSTQFASALKLIMAFNEKIIIEAIHVKSSETYLKMTEAVIEHFKKSNNYTIPADFSSLSYPAVLAALAGEIFISNVFELDSLQADSQLLSLLKDLGAVVEFNQLGLTIKHGKSLKPFIFDVSKAPDLFPTLVVLASKINGATTFINLEVLAFKESDRLSEMIKLLQLFECRFEGDGQKSLTIYGEEKRFGQSTYFEPVRDHRIVMATSLMMSLNAGGVLTNGDCVSKSYPEFWNLF